MGCPRSPVRAGSAISLPSLTSFTPLTDVRVRADHKFNPLDHMSGISPYHDAPNADITPPAGCKVAAAAFLIRHGSIYANDDEYDDYMEPFISRVVDAQNRGVAIPDSSHLAFLSTWRSAVNESNLEMITEPGKRDAYEFGKRFRDLYGDLMPPVHLGKGKGKGGRKGKGKKKEPKVKTPFKVWSASSERDVETSKAWVRGAFPHWQAGKGGGKGEGDGKFIQLVAVKNKVRRLLPSSHSLVSASRALNPRVVSRAGPGLGALAHAAQDLRRLHERGRQARGAAVARHVGASRPRPAQRRRAGVRL